MPSRNKPEPATADDVIEAVQVLSGTVEHANAYLEMIAENLEKVRSEISWIIENREQILPLMIRSMPADACDPRFGSKVNAAKQEAETVSCAGHCDAYMDSLADAVKAGWSRLTHDPDGMSWYYLGICPDCQKKDAEESEALPEVSSKPKKNGTLFPD